MGFFVFLKQIPLRTHRHQTKGKRVRIQKSQTRKIVNLQTKMLMVRKTFMKNRGGPNITSTMMHLPKHDNNIILYTPILYLVSYIYFIKIAYKLHIIVIFLFQLFALVMFAVVVNKTCIIKVVSHLINRWKIARICHQFMISGYLWAPH